VAAPASAVESVAGVLRVRDTCNVYALRSGREAVLIDFGSGAVLDRLDELGVDRVTDVLVTHHHRDQVQGLERAAAAGIRIWVPPVERELFERVDARWQSRPVDNDYDLREDRFALVEPVEVTGAVDEYRTTRFGGFDVYALPTPGHTVGSLTYLVEVDGRRLAFSGDLVYGEGKVWSLAATQWSYTGVEGQAATILSCGMLGDREPDVLLPSHGEPVEDPQAALSLVRSRLQELVDLRMPWEWNLEDWLRRPWVEITPHVLRNRASFANTYALVSENGAALLFDFGYDLTVGSPMGGNGDPTARRPLLATFDVLRRDFGVRRVEAVVTTHYHDDHVAGLNLLRDVEGAEVWSPENVAPILENPRRFDLPCLWFDPIRVDRTLPLGEPTAWNEYELLLHPLPGHTLYAAAIEFDADGKRFLATGDQQSNDGGTSFLNYQYRNRFGSEDFVRSAELYRSRRPDVLLTGHWAAMDVTDAWLDRVAEDAGRVADLHAEMLPEEGFGPEGFGARIEPYRSSVPAGGEVELDVLVRNPFDRDATAAVRLALPAGWDASPAPAEVDVDPLGEATVRVRVHVGPEPVRRARVAADLTVGGVRFGQQAEALVDVE
jgi:glyoxylase-like metal-dependent hydrolase (beta-lactamase superfamily II)